MAAGEKSCRSGTLWVTLLSVVHSVLDTAEAAVDFVAENPGKTAAIVVGTVATSGAALAVAPAIGAAVSVARFSVAGGAIRSSG